MLELTHLRGNNRALQEPVTFPGVYLPVCGDLCPKLQGWVFTHALFGGVMLPGGRPQSFPLPHRSLQAQLGGCGCTKLKASVKHLGLISLFTTDSFGATFMACEVIWHPLVAQKMPSCRGRWLSLVCSAGTVCALRLAWSLHLFGCKET